MSFYRTAHEPRGRGRGGKPLDSEVLMTYESADPQDASLLEGRYANYFEVGYNPVEFVIRIGQHFAGRREPYFHTKIVTSPYYAKALLETLRESIDQYKQTVGRIPNDDASEPEKAG